MLEVINLSYSVGKVKLLHTTTISFAPGRFHVIMGPNGAGKSTLLQLLAGELLPGSGAVRWQDQDLSAYSRIGLARARAVLSQHYHLGFPIEVRDVVALGRYPHLGSLSKADEAALVGQCLRVMQMESFAGRDYGTLSGGEAQKVQMSRVLAQLGGPKAVGKLLLLDEPVSHLDVRYQHLLLQTAKDLCANGNIAIAVLHDLNLALRFADRLLLMGSGNVVHDLPSADALSPEHIREVFSMEAAIIKDGKGQPVVVF